MNDLKQVIVLRDDLEMSRGKMISQACHASLEAYERASKDDAGEWRSKGAKKIALQKGDRSLEEMFEEAKRMGLPAYLVKDAGHTEVEPGTVTALGIGPGDKDKIDQISSELKLIK